MERGRQVSVQVRRRFGAACLVAFCLSTVAVTAEAEPSPTCFGRPATIVGTSRSETLVGTSGSDVIVGLTGNDVISGRGGGDRICGNDGADTLRGGDGDDIILGQGGADTVTGGNGGDRLVGRSFDWDQRDPARDELRGGPGPDRINFVFYMEDPYNIAIADGGDDPTFGGRGADWLGACADGQRSISGGPGRDTAVFCSEVVADLRENRATFASGEAVRLRGVDNLLGAEGRDVLVGDEGPNVLSAGYDLDEPSDPPADELVGNGGNDVLVASPGDLVIEGGDGNDRFETSCCSGDERPSSYRFEGGSGDDTLEVCVIQGGMQVHFVLLGGEGSDTASFCLGATANLITGSGSLENGSGTASFESIENLRGSYDNDRLVGDEKDNTISGADGGDHLDAGAGTDTIVGGGGVDLCLNGETLRGCP